MLKAKTIKEKAAAAPKATVLADSGILSEIKLKKPKKEINKNYQAKGVLLSREVSTVYQPVKITYDGLLAKSGATELYAHAGIGTGWENVQDVKMAKTKSGGFEATVIAAEAATLNVCFRDGAYNWDNNADENYVFSVVQ